MAAEPVARPLPAGVCVASADRLGRRRDRELGGGLLVQREDEREGSGGDPGAHDVGRADTDMLEEDAREDRADHASHAAGHLLEAERAPPALGG